MARLPDVPAWFFQLTARECNHLRILFLNVARPIDPSVYACQKSETTIFYPTQLVCCQIISFFRKKKKKKKLQKALTQRIKMCPQILSEKQRKWESAFHFVCFSKRDKKMWVEGDKSWCTLTNGDSSCVIPQTNPTNFVADDLFTGLISRDSRYSISYVIFGSIMMKLEERQIYFHLWYSMKIVLRIFIEYEKIYIFGVKFLILWNYVEKNILNFCISFFALKFKKRRITHTLVTFSEKSKLFRI